MNIDRDIKFQLRMHEVLRMHNDLSKFKSFK
jgi:hypothetical protein